MGQLDQWTESELERRFAQWLTDYFMTEPVGSAHVQILSEVSSANRRYLYHTDGEGRLLYDATTGDPLVVRPDEGGLETAEADSREWKTQVQGIAEGALGELRSRYMANLPELLPYLREDRREAFESLVAGDRGKSGKFKREGIDRPDRSGGQTFYGTEGPWMCGASGKKRAGTAEHDGSPAD